MFGKRTSQAYEKIFRFGYLTGKAVVEAELRCSMDEADAFRSLMEYTKKRDEECPKGEKLEYKDIIEDWLKNMISSRLHVILGGKT